MTKNDVQSVKEYEEAGDAERESLCFSCVLNDIDQYFIEYRQCCVVLCNTLELRRRKDECIRTVEAAMQAADQRAHRAKLERYPH